MQRIVGGTPARSLIWLLLEARAREEDLADVWPGSSDALNKVIRFVMTETRDVAATVAAETSNTANVLQLRIETEDAALADRWRELLNRWTPENSEALKAFEFARAEKLIELAYRDAGAKRERGDYRHRALDMPSARALTALYEREPSNELRHILLFEFQAPKTARPVKRFLAGWLLAQLGRAENYRHGGALAIALDFHISAEEADSLSELLSSGFRATGNEALYEVLAKTKTQVALELLASRLERHPSPCVIRGLRYFGREAGHLEPKLRALLRTPDPDLRREVKKTLFKVGAQLDPPPAPIHATRKKPPKQLAEWSAGLDLSAVRSLLELVARQVGSGFGPPEIDEVVGQTEFTPKGRSKQFKFDLTNSADRELWIEVFLEDSDAVEVYLHGSPELMRRISDAAVASDDL